MKKDELEKINYSKIYNEFMDSMRGYIGKDDTKKMFYSIIYLIYLANIVMKMVKKIILIY